MEHGNNEPFVEFEGFSGKTFTGSIKLIVRGYVTEKEKEDMILNYAKTIAKKRETRSNGDEPNLEAKAIEEEIFVQRKK